jgi:hypothetical protein
MKKSIMKKWVSLLRSGEFSQGTGHLNKEGKHCCLGVLCELATVEGITVPHTSGEYAAGLDIIGYGDFSEEENCGVLPLGVQKWAGMDSRNGEFNYDQMLTDLNDIGSSFDELADIIEKNYKNL